MLNTTTSHKNKRDGNFESSKGFTLIETLVSVSILLVAIVGPLALVQKSLNSASFTREQITAFYLGQDAMEYLTNVRDNDTRNGTNVFPVVVARCIGANGCIIDTRLNTPLTAVTTCSSACAPLKLSPSGTYYGYQSGWTATEYVRMVKITPSPSNSDENYVEVTMTWVSQAGATYSDPRSLTLSRIMYDFAAAKAKREAELES